MANQLPKHFDTQGRDVGGLRRIQIRTDSPAGVCLGPGVDLYPGEEADVPGPVAARLVAAGKARYVEATPVPAPAPAAPVEVKTPEAPAVAHRDPTPAKRRGK